MGPIKAKEACHYFIFFHFSNRFCVMKDVCDFSQHIFYLIELPQEIAHEAESPYKADLLKQITL